MSNNRDRLRALMSDWEHKNAAGQASSENAINDLDAETYVRVKLPPGLKPPKGWQKKAFAGKKVGDITIDFVINAAKAAIASAAEAQTEAERHIPCRLCVRLTEPATNTNDWNVDVGVVFANDPSVLIKTESRIFSQLSPGRRDTASKTLATKLPLACGMWVPLRRVGRNTGSRTATTGEVLELIQSTTAKLRELDVEVQLPSCLEKDANARRVVVRCSVGEWNGEGGAGLSAKALLSARLELAVDGVPLTAEELDRVAQLKQPLVRLRGKWFYFDPKEWETGELKRIVERAQSAVWQTESAGTLVRDAMFGRIGSTSIPFEVTATNSRGQELVDRLIQNADVPLVELPRGLKTKLRLYQHEGYSWLSFLSDLGLGACLADDMGLGKTLQTLVWLLRAKEQNNDKPSLLVCPTSVMRNWNDECEKFTPSLRMYEHYGTNRLDRPLTFFAEARKHDVVITTYNVLQRDLELFTTVPWHAVILDEAQNIKNHTTQQSRAVREPKLTAGTSFRMALTGTPIENHAGDIWPIMDFLNPGLLGNWTQFERDFVAPIRNDRDAKIRDSLKRIIQPFMLRRMKSDPKIAPSLPEKLESIEWCSLTREQAEWYRTVLSELEEKANTPDRFKRQSAVLTVLMKLKQTCNHPALLIKDRSQLGARSGKLNRLVEMLEEVLDNGEKALIFTQYAQMATMLGDFLGDRFRVGTDVLSGEKSVDQRKKIVKTFQEDARFPILILTLKAGGVGLNLPAANHVFHFDRWWNPAVEDQATDRAYRIGQTKTVNVHKFVCVGTLEERIAQMLDEKKSLSKELLGEASDESLAGHLSKLDVDELRSFLRLEDKAVGDD